MQKIIAKAICKRVGRHTLADFKTYHKGTAIKTVSCKNKHIAQ